MNVRDIARRALAAGRRLAQSPAEDRASLLNAMADALADPSRRGQIVEANGRDMAAAEAACARGELDEALVKRLGLDARKLDGLCDGLRQLAGATDLVGRVRLRRELDEGLVLEQVSCPLGVLGVVFEARPDAVPQITGLAVRSGNAVLLKGGKEARGTNRVLVEILRGAVEVQGLDPDLIGLLEDRAEVDEMLGLHDVIDMIVARGSGKFVGHVLAHSKIPVLGHAEGLCHLYLHRSADPEQAAIVAVDAKCSYPAACNAIETLLWDAGAEAALDAAVVALRAAGVELRACEATRARHPDLVAATPDDWSTEYGNLTLSIRRVDDLDGALAHIQAHGSRHTDAIIASDGEAATRFLASVDAAGVFHNASTRFADGYRYGLGAEVGVSTSKLHARGPVGVEGLLTYRWLLRGHGQVTTDYGPGKRAFSHLDLPID